MPAYSWAFILLIVSSLPGQEIQTIQVHPENLFLRVILSDPFMHFSLFGLLAVLVYRGFQPESEGSGPLLKVAFLAVGYGLLIEVYQGLLPWRGFGLDDLIWNTFGVLSATGGIQGFRMIRGFRNASIWGSRN